MLTLRCRPVSPPTIQHLLQTAAISLGAGLLATLPARSADTIYFDYGPFGRSLPTASLETFAEEGIVDENLEPYLELVPPDRRQQFQQTLSTPLSELSADVPELVSDPFVISQWLYAPIGELVLAGVGELIQTESRLNGQQAIRAAVILAAAEPDGISLLNLIRAYPTGSIRLNLRQILALSKAVSTNIETTDRLVAAAIASSAAATAADPVLDYSGLPLLAENGLYEVEMRSLRLQDDQRDRTFPADLYFPRDFSTIQGPIPVIVLSHGYGDTRKNPGAIAAARKIASYGFFVAMPEHIGSNKAYQDKLAKGLVHESFEAMEFVNRPLDIQFLLDTLEQQNTVEFLGQLQLDRVGVLGHSFGGYTALVTAGATLDINHLQRQCTIDENIEPDKVNIALLLECRALELLDSPEAMRQLTDGSLADERVALVMPLAPVSSLFGTRGVSQIKIPVVIIGGTRDIASPVALEQFTTFRGLTTSEKYLYVGANIAHTPALTQLALNVTNPNSDIVDNFEETAEVFSNVMASLAIAHTQVHLQGNDAYRPYLTASYIEAATVDPFKLYLLRSVPQGF